MEITEKTVRAMLAHGRREEPNEACGYLASEGGVVTHSFELTNIDAAPDHYTMDPREQFAVIRTMREKGLKVAAVYHSHPETPARPSLEDIRLANDPDMIYVIVSLMAGVDPVRAYRISRGEVTDVPLRVLSAQE